MPYFLQHFSKNWVKTLVHGTLQKKLLISRRSTSFGGFSPNAILLLLESLQIEGARVVTGALKGTNRVSLLKELSWVDLS